jgi:hypothetical protein
MQSRQCERHDVESLPVRETKSEVAIHPLSVIVTGEVWAQRYNATRSFLYTT